MRLTECVQMGREGEPEELKGVYLYLASDASSFTTGTDIIVDGMLPPGKKTDGAR